MLGRLHTYLSEGNVFTSLEISEFQGRQLYSLLVVKREKGELYILNTKSSDQPEELKKFLVKNSPLFLTLNTSNVLTKQIGNLDSFSPEAIVNHVFPNLSLDSFYFEIIQEKTNPLISISKMEYVSEMLNTLQQLGFYISGMSLGVSSILSILPYFEKSEVRISNANLTLKNQSVYKINPIQEESTEKHDINGIALMSQYLLPFSQILGHLESKPSLSNFSDLNYDLASNFKNKRIFEKVIKVAVLFFLALLFINFFVFDYYHNTLENQKANLEISASQRQQLTRLEQAVQQKQEREEMFNTSSNSKSTFYLDKLAKGVPSTILLYEIAYQPLIKPVRESKPIELGYNSILVSGVSENSHDFSEWIIHLEKNEWIVKVESMDYDYLSEGKSNFSVKIEIHEN